MTQRVWQVLVIVSLLVAAAYLMWRPPTPPARGSGDDSLRADLTPPQRQQALEGKVLFHKAFTVAEGLGPHFNATSCASCHGDPASGGHGDMAHAARMTLIGDSQDGLPKLAIPGHTPLVPKPGMPIGFRKPPALFGLGLLEAIDADYLVAHCGKSDSDGIHGVANVNAGQHKFARIGYKAHTATVEDFVANAFSTEMGMTNPQERDPLRQRDADTVADPEAPTATVQLLTAYVRALAPPSAAAADAKAEATFATTGCATCHRPETGPNVKAYSDLCVHDLGPTFSDQMPVFLAGPSQWRTQPLWGLRWRNRYFHDDRTADLDTAVRSHGGEASKVVERYAQLPDDARKHLLAWLKTL